MAVGGGGDDKFSFITHVVRGRWFTVFACLWIMAGSGATYLFELSSKELQRLDGIDQHMVDLLGIYKSLGANLGIIAGLIAEVTPSWFMLIIGSVMNFSGYYLLHQAVMKSITLRLWQICFCVFLGNNAQNFTNTAALVSCVKNFPEKRGIVIGILKGLVGLSGAIMTQLCLAFYGDADSRYIIILVGWFPSLVALAFSFTIRPMKFQRQPNELRVFFHIFYITIFLALYLMTVTIIQRSHPFNRLGYAAGGIAILFFLSLPLLIVIREERFLWSLKQKPIKNPVAINMGSTTIAEDAVLPDASQLQQDQLMQKIGQVESTSCCTISSIASKPGRGEDHTILQAICSIDMLLIFIASLCGLGSCITAIDNLWEIGYSLDVDLKIMGSIVVLINIWNYFGRVYAGFVSELLLKRRGTSRPLMNVFALLLSCIGILLMAFPSKLKVYIASVIIGFSYGAQVTLLFTIISEVFGLKYYSTLMNCAQLASPLGSYLLNTKLTRELYKMEARDLDKKADLQNLVCKGNSCFRKPFIIIANVIILGAVASFVLAKRTAKFYKSDLYKKFKEHKNFEVEMKATQEESASSTSSHGRW